MARALVGASNLTQPLPKIPKALTPQKQIAGLYAKRSGVTDPTQTNRINSRISFLQKGAGLPREGAITTPPGTTTPAQGPIIPKAQPLPNQPQIDTLNTKLAGSTDPAQQARINQRIGFLTKAGAFPATRSPQQAEARKLQEKIAAGNLPPDQIERINKRLKFLQNHYDVKLRPVATTPEVTTPGAPSETVPDPAADPGAEVPATQPQPIGEYVPETPQPETFKTLEDFVPKDPTMSAFYEEQKKAGMKDLARLMASRGFQGSGAEIAGNVDLLQKLGAEEVERQKSIAQVDYQAYRDSQRDTADKETQGARDRWGQTMDVLNLIMAQNPMGTIGNLTGKDADLAMDWGQILGNIKRDQYGRVISSGGGGGGGGGGGYVPPPPSLADAYSPIAEGLRENSRGQSGNSWIDLISGLAGSFLGGSGSKNKISGSVTKNK